METERILCSACFDEQEREFSTIIPQSVCAKCGKKCLGYVVSVD